MKAMIFAAGLGSRLKPLTDQMPKALVPVQGQPMLQRVLLKLKEAGFDQVIINIHHLGQQIIDFLEAHNNFGMRIYISDERDYLLDTGGGIKKASYFLQGDEPFLVHNVDILSDVDLRAFYDSHCQSKALASLLVSKRETSRYLLFDKQQRLCGWRNRATGEVKSFYPYFDPSHYTEYAFAGIHMISPEIFRWMEEWTGKFSIIQFYLSICARVNLRAYPADNLTLFDVGKTETLAQAEQWISQMNAQK
ncbi:MAG: nucleotidyltransferase family protein [Parabacteroides sp.]|mgnify:CR=1 FL=1|nr:nucleotidyltransferase family protein [Parabacteroides distasonis]MCI6876446.1 nucleotidyltransferase family protein [Parabacteroides sp.]MDD6099677.1 nucleotidyltransferase family protein [bacterium]MDD6836537.1 nucleotidyltransferase family protein [bacterium]MDD7631671.1 nucleotidyltransferase family protein [bacterium]